MVFPAEVDVLVDVGVLAGVDARRPGVDVQLEVTIEVAAFEVDVVVNLVVGDGDFLGQTFRELLQYPLGLAGEDGVEAVVLVPDSLEGSLLLGD